MLTGSSDPPYQIKGMPPWSLGIVPEIQRTPWFHAAQGATYYLGMYVFVRNSSNRVAGRSWLASSTTYLAYWVLDAK